MAIKFAGVAIKFAGVAIKFAGVAIKFAGVAIAALAELPRISTPKDPLSSFAAHVLSILHEAGSQPRVGHQAIEIHTALGLVAAGLGYARLGAAIAAHGHNAVVFVKLP